MKVKLLLIFTLIGLSGFSQSAIWTKGNAVWHYGFTNVGESGYIKAWESGDTVILGKQCTRIKAKRHSFMMTGPNGPLFESVTDYLGGIVYTSNDTVYYWDGYADQFFVLYDFSAQANDQWLLQAADSAFGCNDTSVCVVESTGSVLLNGQNTTELTLTHTPDSYMHLSGKANARFGATGSYLFPFPRWCENQGGLDIDMVSFLCFEDDSLYYNPSGGACEYYLGMDEYGLSNLSVFPNPSAGKIEVLSEIPLKNIRVVNMLGAVLKEFPTSLTLVEIDLTDLPQGTYYLHIENTIGDQIVKPVRLLTEQ